MLAILSSSVAGAIESKQSADAQQSKPPVGLRVDYTASGLRDTLSAAPTADADLIESQTFLSGRLPEDSSRPQSKPALP